jgi:hypothetical protein
VSRWRLNCILQGVHVAESKKTDEKRVLTPEEWASLRNEQNFTAMFRALQPGWSLQIKRLRPTWCEGWCDTVEFDPEEPIDLEYIRDNWGGSRFKLQVFDELHQYKASWRVSIDAPPRRNGRLLEDPETAERRRRKEERDLERDRLLITPPAQSSMDSTLGNMMTELIKTTAASKDDQLGFVKDLLMLNMKKEPEGRRDIKEILELATSMREMVDLFGGGSGGDDPWANNIGKFADILSARNAIDSKRAPGAQGAPGAPQQRPPQQPPVRIVRNLGNANQAPPAAAEPQAPAPAQAPPQTASLSGSQIASTLAFMNPTDAAAVVMTTLSKMPQDNRDELFSILGVDFGESYDDEEEQDPDVEDTDGPSHGSEAI